MKIIKKGEQAYYYGVCEYCGTELICSDEDDRDLIRKNALGSYYIKCPVCPNNEIKITIITKGQYDFNSKLSEYKNVGIRNSSEN